MVRLDDKVDGAVEDVDLRIAQQGRDPLDVDRTVHALQRRECGAADQLVRVLEQAVQRRLHLGSVKAREGIDDVYAGDRILALHTTDELTDRGLIGDLTDDAKQRRLLVRVLCVGGGQKFAYVEARLLGRDDIQHRGLGDAGRRERFEQQMVRVVATVGERPGNPGDDARAALDQAAHELREALLADELGEHLDERQGCGLVRFGQGAEDRLDSARPDFLQPCDRLLPGRACRIGRGPDLSDETVGTQVREKAHSAFP